MAKSAKQINMEEKQELEQEKDKLQEKLRIVNSKLIEVNRPFAMQLFKAIDKLLKERGYVYKIKDEVEDLKTLVKGDIEIFNCPHLCKRIEFKTPAGTIQISSGAWGDEDYNEVLINQIFNIIFNLTK